MMRTPLVILLVTLIGAVNVLAQTLSPGANVQAAVNAAVAPTTITLGAGTFTGTVPLTLPGGITLTGSGKLSTHLVWTLPATVPYAIVFAPNASNVTISNLDLSSSNSLFDMRQGTKYGPIAITACNWQFGTASNGLDVYGLFETVPCSDLEITYNYFHDSMNTDRTYQAFAASGHIDHNSYFNVHDGGHLLECVNLTWSYNYAQNVCRMGQEVQASGQGESNLVFDHDVVFDHPQAFNDSEGISLCPNFTTGCVVSNGYFRQSLSPGGSFGSMTGGAVGGPNRFGYGGESIAPGAQWINDTFVLSSLSADGICAGEPCTANGCQVWGGSNALWGAFVGGDGTPAGAQPGSVTQTNCTVTQGLVGAPLPPANTFAGPAFYVATPVPPIVPPPATQPTLTSITTVTSTSGAYSDGTSRQLSQTTATTKP
jgi:hypothetical protein